MKDLNAEQRDTVIDQYCDWFVKNSSRKVLEMMAWDALHEDLHNLCTPDLLVAVETDCPELLKT